MNRIIKSAHLLLMFSMLAGITGCENGNLFGRINKTGGSNASLESDASIALRNRDYQAALELYTRILDQNPNNAVALYGKSAAALGVSGLNLGTLISNILKQTNSASVSNLAETVSASRESFSASSAASNSILAGIAITRLKQELPAIRQALYKVVQGQTDLTILPRDVDASLNLAVVLIVDAAVTALDIGLIDIVNDNGSYGIEEGPNYNTVCSDTASVRRIGSDLIISYIVMQDVVSTLGLNNNQIISRFLSDVREVADKLLDPASSDALPAACRSELSNVGIVFNSYGSYSGGLQ